MKETGVIRRIDELGRIVIPKEIRKRLRVGSGDLLDIYTNNDQVILTKYSPISEMTNSLVKLLQAIKEETKSDIIITDKTKVIASTTDIVKIEEEILEGFIKLVVDKDEVELLKTTNVNITKNYQNKTCLLAKKIVSNGDFMGTIIVLNDNIITKTDRELSNMLKRYVLLHIIEES